jgi:signal transduction histidine kinase
MEVNASGKVNILVVDDETEVRRKLVAALSNEDYHCVPAANAGQARRKLAQTSFDLVLLDLSLPGTAGTELTVEITSSYPDTSIIVVTMIDAVGVAVQCMKAGAVDYLVKPVEPEKLRESVSRALNVRAARLAFREYQSNLEKAIQKEKRLRTEFVHSVAHEIKTPLTAIVTSSEMLGLDSQPEAFVHKMADNIRQSAWSLNEKVNEMATLGKISDNDPCDEPLDTRFAIQEVYRLVQKSLSFSEQSLSLEIAGQLPFINVRGEDFKQILQNLISNTSKFSPHGSRVILRAQDSGNRVVIEVEDEATPIPENEKNQLFGLYYRGEDEERIKRIPGLGIGLFVVKKLVEKYGGEIRVNNRLKKGNIFTFSLPYGWSDRKPKTADKPPILQKWNSPRNGAGRTRFSENPTVRGL